MNAMSNQKWLLSPETTITECFSMLPIPKKTTKIGCFIEKQLKMIVYLNIFYYLCCTNTNGNKEQ